MGGHGRAWAGMGGHGRIWADMGGHGRARAAASRRGRELTSKTSASSSSSMCLERSDDSLALRSRSKAPAFLDFFFSLRERRMGVCRGGGGAFRGLCFGGRLGHYLTTFKKWF